MGGEDEPEPAGASKHLTISIKDPQGEAIQFRVKKETSFEKIFGAFEKQKGVGPQTYSYFFDGNRLARTGTVKFHEMEDGDQIDAQLEQTGG